MPVLVYQTVLGHAHSVPILQPTLSTRGSVSPLERPVESTTEKKLIGPRLRRFLRIQQVLLTVGVLVCAVLWALRVPTNFMHIIVMSICIGNVLNTVMDYACRWYDRFSPPWNWVVYIPVLAAVSVLGTVLAAGVVYAMSSAGITFMSVFRSVAPFSMVVSMTVGTVWYAVERIQVHLRERNVQLETALAAETSVVRTQEQELARARQIQQELLPKSIPQLRGIQVAGAWQPASAVSGDYYDVLALDQDRLAICIGDVVGKGITAALLMANLQAAFRAFATADASPASVCGKLNTFMCGNVASGKFISFFYCIVDARDRSIAYENAGHCPAQLVRRSGETVSLYGEGAVLGVLPDWNYRNNRLQLQSGDRLVLFTDGVTEAENSYGTEFGEDRVVQALQDSAGRSAEEVRRTLMEAVTGYCSGNFRDDATVVVLAVQ
ncbi:MAG TPA: PP2C family protein-serine/threonine phosphatase [Candidatus Methylomirabilis sp.]|nr:PP2C family protein-serine/threonine phosphatase [Candidatus Methylomirabilis sp.]